MSEPAKDSSKALHPSMIATGWLKGAPSEMLDAVLASARRLRFKDGEMIFALGSPPTCFFMVLTGRVRIRRLTPSGRESVYWVVRRNQWFGEISLLDGKPRTHDAIATGDTELLALASGDFHRILDRFPEGWQRMMRLVCSRLRTAFDNAERAAQAPLDASIATMLLLLADRTETFVSISTEDLGEMVNRTRQTVAKRLEAWEKAGLIRRQYRQIELLDLAELDRISQSQTDTI